MGLGVDSAIFRLAAFIIGLAIFPPLAPRITRLALAAAILIFCLPLIVAGASGPATVAVWASRAVETNGAGPAFGSLYTELTIGLVLGTALSIAARAVSLIAAWLGAVLFPTFSRRLSRAGVEALGSRFDRGRIELLLGIVFVVSIIESGALDRVIFLAAGSFKLIPPGSAAFASANWRQLLFDLADASILIALCLSAPLFFLLLFTELTGIVLRRCLPASFYPGFIEAARVPLVLLMFGLTFSMITSQLQEFQETALDRLESVAQGR